MQLAAAVPVQLAVLEEMTEIITQQMQMVMVVMVVMVYQQQ